MASEPPKTDTQADPFPEAVRLALRFVRDPCSAPRSRAQRMRKALKGLLRSEGLRCTGIGDDEGHPLPEVPAWLDPTKTEPSF